MRRGLFSPQLPRYPEHRKGQLPPGFRGLESSLDDEIEYERVVTVDFVEVKALLVGNEARFGQGRGPYCGVDSGYGVVAAVDEAVMEVFALEDA